MAQDPIRPTGAYPTRSGLSGLLASALGWTYADGKRTTALQYALRYAVREDRRATRIRDYQTADLDRIGRTGWARHGLERRGGGTAATGTHVLEKHYLADAAFTVALTLEPGAPTTLDDLEQALRTPARPLHLGRRGCLPASPIWRGRITATAPYEALSRWPIDPTDIPHGDPNPHRRRCWYADGDGPNEGEPNTVWDHRNFETDRFSGSRLVRTYYVDAPETINDRNA